MVSRINTTSRFSSAPWFDEAQKLNVLIAGLGGIGSNVAYNIGRIHPSINKDEIYLIELSLNKLIKPIKKIKYNIYYTI